MLTLSKEHALRLQTDTGRMLHKLRFGIHRLGYQQLLLLIPCYAQDCSLSLSKELYPYAAGCFGCSSWQAVEHTVRAAILDAWERRDAETWEKYFPGMKRPPSNKQFIATMAELLKNAPPG